MPLKGVQRVIPLLPALRERHPKLLYPSVGGGALQGDMRSELEALADPTVCEPVDWWDPYAFRDAIDRGIARQWDREAIVA